ncbi:MAG: hypothetical protein QXL89_09290 [Nitrososphaeria archaeon]
MVERRNIERSVFLKYGQVGGGIGSSIGPIHRSALAMNGQADLVCGTFSSDISKSIETGKCLKFPLTEFMLILKTWPRENLKERIPSILL